jgi:hypothetical protein
VKLFSSPIRGGTPAACLADRGKLMTESPAMAAYSRPRDGEAELDSWVSDSVDVVLGPEEQMTGKGGRGPQHDRWSSPNRSPLPTGNAVRTTITDSDQSPRFGHDREIR